MPAETEDGKLVQAGRGWCPLPEPCQLTQEAQPAGRTGWRLCAGQECANAGKCQLRGSWGSYRWIHSAAHRRWQGSQNPEGLPWRTTEGPEQDAFSFQKPASQVGGGEAGESLSSSTFSTDPPTPTSFLTDLAI